jgi:hypothetical protein
LGIKEEISQEDVILRHFWINKNLLVMQDDILFYRWLESDGKRIFLMVPDCLKTQCSEVVMTVNLLGMLQGLILQPNGRHWRLQISLCE